MTFDETDASREGREAFLAGKPVTDNPYSGLRGSEWIFSWYSARSGSGLVAVTFRGVAGTADAGDLKSPS